MPPTAALNQIGQGFSPAIKNRVRRTPTALPKAGVERPSAERLEIFQSSSVPRSRLTTPVIRPAMAAAPNASPNRLGHVIRPISGDLAHEPPNAIANTRTNTLPERFTLRIVEFVRGSHHTTNRASQLGSGRVAQSSSWVSHSSAQLRPAFFDHRLIDSAV